MLGNLEINPFFVVLLNMQILAQETSALTPIAKPP
jgi:hypothetical protein